MTIKKVLSIDGGGAKGVIPFTMIKNIEKEVGKPIYEIFDLIVGSSIGAIIPAVLTINGSSAEELLPIFKDTIRDIFTPRVRFPFFQPKYDRKRAVKFLDKYIGGKKLSDAKTKYMLTSVNIVSGRTHFFKSWEKKDGKLDAIEVVNRTYAAPLYFGSLVDKKNKAVWLDGGTSNNNSPVMESYIEILRQGWTGSTKVHMLSLGCGQKDYSVPFKKASRYKNIKQVFYYMEPVQGGAARIVSSDSQNNWLKELDEVTPNFTFQRINLNNMDPNLDGMDKIMYLDEYESIGENLSKQINYDLLK